MQKSTDLRKSDIAFLEVQRFVGRCLLLLIGPLVRGIVKYRFGMTVAEQESIQKEYRSLIESADGPLILCPNHLTMADSIIHAVFLNSIRGYFFNYSSLPWSVPEHTKFYHKWNWRLVCYVGKCIPVLRNGPPEESKRTLAKMRYVLNRGDILSIFPEGRRSRSGRIDTEDFSYATGQLLKFDDNPSVICLYARGKKHGGFSDFPHADEEFYFKMQKIRLHSEFKGMKRARDYSTQIIQCLSKMEGEYFAEDRNWQ